MVGKAVANMVVRSKAKYTTIQFFAVQHKYFFELVHSYSLSYSYSVNTRNIGYAL